MEKRCSNCSHCYERSNGPHCGGCFIEDHSNWEEALPPLQPKFKVGDKVIFTSRLNGDNTKGTITKVFEKGSVAIRNGDYVVKEYDSNSFWEVWENDITGIWDESPSLPSPDFLDYFRYFPKFNIPIFKNDAILRVDTDSIKVKEDKKMKDRPRDHKFVKSIFKERRIKEVMFNGPATIIKWEPTTYDICVNGNTKGDKTVSVCGEGDKYDKTTGFLLAVIKEFVDNQSYDNILRTIDSFNDKGENEIHLNFTGEEMAKEFIDDVEAVKDLLPEN